MAAVRAIHKIKILDRDDVFLVSDYEPQKKLSLNLFDVDKCEAFSGTATDIELRSHAAKIGMTFSTLIDLTTKAFTQNEFDELQFLYSLEENCQDFVFKWKSMDSDETTITIGIVSMYKNEYQSTIKDVFILLSKELLSLNKKVSDIETDLINSHKEKENSMCLLAEATKVRERIENELYSKFTLVLNEKKRKIQELSGDTCSNASKKIKVSENKPPNKVLKNRVHAISDSDSDDIDGYLSDFDKNVPGSSNAKRDTSLLFLDEDEPVVSVSPSKVRNRKVARAPVVKGLSEGVHATLSGICDSDSDDDLLKNL